MTLERFEKIKNVLKKRQPDIEVILDGVHKPHNLAAILRTCDATGIGSIHAKSKKGKYCSRNGWFDDFAIADFRIHS